MSYSRWSNSKWYTFWCVSPEGVETNRDNALFEICGVKTFTAKNLRENLGKCMAEVMEVEPCEEEEIKELRGYAIDFLSAVDREHHKVAEWAKKEKPITRMERIKNIGLGILAVVGIIILFIANQFSKQEK